MSDASSSAHGTSVPQATATPATTQSQAQYSNHNQATDQSTQTAATSAVHAAAAAAAVAAVGNQNGTNVTNGTEEFVCMWQGCSERSSSAETLYEHVCERHVGRKSTNNLNLTCQWGNCRTTTVKRDHITSHIRVHVPLKPHKCDLCGKAFKRPQDLKKHVKTHADDSVLIRSPEPGRSQEVPFGGMVNNPKGYSAGAHYFEPAMNPVHGGQNYHQPPPYYQGQSQQHAPNPAYGNVFYTLNQGDNNPPYDSRKRPFDSVNDFFGDAKRRHFDITSYAAIGQRLGGLQGLQLPLSPGPAPDYHSMPLSMGVSSGGGYGPALATPAYHLPPMSNARTKHDLLDLDRMLDTIHTTVYENDDHVAAAGIAQPGATYIQHRMAGYGTAQQSSPIQLPSSHATAAGAHAASASSMATASAHSPTSGTPALTPPSSAQSYTSGRSPGSFSQRVSPPQHDTPMYPRLPSTTGHESMASAYPTTTGAAPPSTLSGNYDYEDHRRRYTGGSLMRSRPDDYRSASTFSGSDERERTPTAGKERPKESSRSPEQFSSSLIDPALQSTSSPDAEAAQRTAQAATDAAKRAEDEWLENVRILEQLRAYIKDRLARADYEDDSEGTSAERVSSSSSSSQGDHMEGVEKTSGATDASVESAEEKSNLYPTLKVEYDDDSKME